MMGTRVTFGAGHPETTVVSLMQAFPLNAEALPQACRDGDATCDGDGAADGPCTFRVAVACRCRWAWACWPPCTRLDPRGGTGGTLHSLLDFPNAVGFAVPPETRYRPRCRGRAP